MSPIGSRVPKLILAVLLAGGTIGVAACRPHVSRARADDIARVELAKYAEREHLSLSSFSTAEATEHDNGIWLYNYTYRGKPAQLVSIIIESNGRAKVTRMFEKDTAP